MGAFVRGGMATEGYAAAQAAAAQAAAISEDLGVGQGWQDFTASRVLNTTYVNTTLRAMAVNVTLLTNPTARVEFVVNGLRVHGSTVPNTGGTYAAYNIIVPAGATYRAEFGGVGTLAFWVELR